MDIAAGGIRDWAAWGVLDLLLHRELDLLIVGDGLSLGSWGCLVED